MKVDIDRSPENRFAALAEVSRLAASERDVQRLLRASLGEVRRALDFDRCTLALLNEDGQTYQVQQPLDGRRGRAKVAEQSLPLSEGIPGAVIREGQPRLITERGGQVRRHGCAGQYRFHGSVGAACRGWKGAWCNHLQRREGGRVRSAGHGVRFRRGGSTRPCHRSLGSGE